MRLSPQRHTLAVLRVLIGLTQKELANLLKRSVVTIQKIELGKLPLGADLADEIAGQCDVDLQWLLENDVSKPPLDVWRQPYTKSTFEKRQAFLQAKCDGEDPAWAKFGIWAQVTEYLAIAGSAAKKNQFQLFNYKLRKAFNGLKAEFGFDFDIASPFDNPPEKDTGKTYEKDSIAALQKLFKAVDAARAKAIKKPARANERV